MNMAYIVPPGLSYNYPVDSIEIMYYKSIFVL